MAAILLISGALTILFLPLLFLILRWWWAYSVWSRAGVPGPKPVLYYGNEKQTRSLGILKFIEINLKEYGNTFGYYIGISPSIVIKDLEMLKQIMVKHFDNFIDRQHNPDLLRKPSASKARGILNSRGQEWRRLRRILSRSFNAINMSKMSPLIERSCESLTVKLSEMADTGKSFDLWKIYGSYTMEVILGAGFGHCVDVINGEADELTEASASIFRFARTSPGSSTRRLLSNFPFMEGYLRKVALKSKAAQNYLFIEKKAEELVRDRLDNGSTHNYQDLLQLLIDARADSDDEDNEGAGQDLGDSYKRKLTHIEIVRTSISMLLAGHETTNNTLAYVSYLLALHPSIQDKLHAEIDEFYSEKPGSTLFEASQNLAYLDMVIQESLRVFPAVPLTTRHTSKDITINGQYFPKDSLVVVPIKAIHHSPDIWPEPSLFKPERFTKEEKEKRHQMSHMPFGWGPRSCIGMRLSLMEAKMALISIMKEYKFVEAPDTEKPLKTTLGITMVPTNGIYLKLAKRE